MRFRDSIFGRLLELINRRQFQTVVDRLNGDACDKSFKSWAHLVALIYAQLSGTDSLRAMVAGFNANAQHHYSECGIRWHSSVIIFVTGLNPLAD